MENPINLLSTQSDSALSSLDSSNDDSISENGNVGDDVEYIESVVQRTLFELEFDDQYENENDSSLHNVVREGNNFNGLMDAGKTDNLDDANMPTKRARQYVAPLREIRTCVKWMRTEHESSGLKGLMVKTAQQFSNLFNTNYKADIQRATRYWEQQDEILNDDNAPKAITRVQNGVCKRTLVKARPGRGRKRSNWVDWLHNELTTEFERLLNIGVEFSASTIITLALKILEDPESLFRGDDILDDGKEKPLYQRITHRWVQTWRTRYGIILKSPSGKPRVSEMKQTYTEQCVAFHLGQIRDRFVSGDLEEDLVQNMDETHIIINQSMGKIYGFKGQNVKLMDVVSGTESLTLVLRVSGGPNAMLHAPFVIFANKSSSYPVRGVPDIIEGVSYRTSPKGWMSRAAFEQYLAEDRAISNHSNGKIIQLFLDNCTGHAATPQVNEILDSKKICLNYLPKNATDVAQPLDSFLIKTFKEIWMQRWQQTKSEMIQGDRFSNNPRGGDFAFSGKLNNPGKMYFLTLAASVARELNTRRDHQGISYARKCMIRTGLSLNLDGTWHINQLSPELQVIVKRHPEHFDGKVPVLPKGI